MPLPPGPVRVTMRLSTRSARTASISSDATDEARDLTGQVRGDVERPERTRVVGDAGHDQPVERHRVFEVLDRAQPIVDELDVAEAPRPRKLPGHGRDDGRARRPRTEQGRRGRRRHHARRRRRRPRLRRPARAARVGRARWSGFRSRPADALPLRLCAAYRARAGRARHRRRSAHVAPLGAVAALVAEVDGAIDPTDENVLAHARVVDASHSSNDAVLPVRFGRGFRDLDDLETR